VVKILQVCHRYFPYIGGVETHVKEISERLVAKGFDVDVFTTSPNRDFQAEGIINGVRVRRFKSWAPSDAYYFSGSMKKSLKEIKNYDVIHAHNYHAFPALYVAQCCDKSNLVFNPHYHDAGHTFVRNILHIPYRQIAKGIFEKSKRIICVSDYERDLIAKRFKVPAEKISIIPNGINTVEFNLPKKFFKDRKVILYVGRLEKYKGVHLLIKMIAKLEDDYCLVIVGKGPYKVPLFQLASKLGVQKRIEFYQDLSRQELLSRFTEADLFVLLSAHEAYGISVAEALASGTPCIVANSSALAEWIDNKNCFGINYPIDIEELACAVNNVIGTKVRVVNLPTWDEATDELEKIYSGIM